MKQFNDFPLNLQEALPNLLKFVKSLLGEVHTFSASLSLTTLKGSLVVPIGKFSFEVRQSLVPVSRKCPLGLRILIPLLA